MMHHVFTIWQRGKKMNLLESLLGGGNNNDVVSELAKQLGVGTDDARKAAEQLVPALGRAINNNASTDAGLDSLINALDKGEHSNYLDNPSSLGQASNDGNAILGHLFGSKDVSRNIANYGAQQSGLSSTLLKKALPILATLVMSSLSKKLMGKGKQSGSIFGGGNDRHGDIFGTGVAPKQNRGMLASFLDADNDGSVFDDLLSLAVKVALR
jgi:hypothetical protein